MDLNLNHLRILGAVAETGSIRRAAERLAVSQPAVSKQLATFESNVGLPLVERLPRGVRLTHAGQVLADYARRIGNLQTQACDAIAELRGGARGRLRVGASTTIAVYLLPEIIVAYRRKYPEVSLQTTVGSSASIARQLADDAIDLGLAEVAPSDPSLEVTVFREDHLVAIAPPSHPLARKHSVTVEQLCTEPFVVRDTGSETKSFVERELARRGLLVSAVMSVGSTEAVKRAVAAGIGVAIVSKLSIDLEVRARRLTVLPIRGLNIRRPLYAVVRGKMPVFPALTNFRRMRISI
jgi:DNA-binding transcriptional LysR family regulator